MTTAPSQGKLLYHITHIDNMPSILQHGLMSRKMLNQYGFTDFVDIADQKIIGKRENYKNALSEYVLFHFYSKNPFDGDVCKKYGSQNMVIITIKRSLHHSKEMFIIPSHPLDKDEPDIYPYEEGFNLVKWEILDRTTGRDYHNSEIKKACMAECIIKRRISPEDFAIIFVPNENVKSRIDAMKKTASITVRVNRNMFP